MGIKLAPSQWFLARGKEKQGRGAGRDAIIFFFPEYSPISVRQKGLRFKAAALSGEEAGKSDCASVPSGALAISNREVVFTVTLHSGCLFAEQKVN